MAPDEGHPPAEPLIVEPLIVEDVLLLLFHPSSRTIAGEGTLFYVLGGAVLAELAASGSVEVDPGAGPGGEIVRAAAGAKAPIDPVLRAAFDHVAGTPMSAQALLALIGPGLREPILERLVRRGFVRVERRKVLGLIPTTRLEPADMTRRAGLLRDVRGVLVDGAEPSARIATIVALLSASGSLPTFDPEIPWSTPVIMRAKELERGDWGAQAAEVAVARTMTAIITTAVTGAMIAAGVLPRN